MPQADADGWPLNKDQPQLYFPTSFITQEINNEIFRFYQANAERARYFHTIDRGLYPDAPYPSIVGDSGRSKPVTRVRKAAVIIQPNMAPSQVASRAQSLDFRMGVECPTYATP